MGLKVKLQRKAWWDDTVSKESKMPGHPARAELSKFVNWLPGGMRITQSIQEMTSLQKIISKECFVLFMVQNSFKCQKKKEKKNQRYSSAVQIHHSLQACMEIPSGASHVKVCSSKNQIFYILLLPGLLGLTSLLQEIPSRPVETFMGEVQERVGFPSPLGVIPCVVRQSETNPFPHRDSWL